MSQIQSPIDVGRLPLKIGSGFAGFTADQWLNWVVIYSPVALKGILPPADLTCWLLYVRACSILCSKVIKKSDVQTADQYLLHFCRSFKALYGPEACTPNMHLHLHLKESLLDYGPVYAFWHFAFERFNGILGAYSTNNKGIEVQLMRKFLNQQKAKDLHFPEQYSDFPTILSKYTTTSGSVLHTSCPASLSELKHMSGAPIHEIPSFELTPLISVLHP